MAIANEILTGRWSRALQKLTSIKGPNPTPQLASEIMPTFSLFYGAECRFLESWNSFGFQFNVTGGAGQNSAVRLRNPPGSNLIGVIYLLTAGIGATGSQIQLQLGAVTTDLTTAQTTNVGRLDSRGGQAPGLIFSQDTNAGSIGKNIGLTVVGANGMWNFISDEYQAIPLLPGDAMDVFCVTVALQLLGTMWWRERQLEESERQ